MTEDDFKKYHRWARTVAGRWWKRVPVGTWDDCLQAAYEGMIIAWDKWDPNKGSFTTYSHYWMLLYLRRNTAANNPKSLLLKVWMLSDKAKMAKQKVELSDYNIESTANYNEERELPETDPFSIENICIINDIINKIVPPGRDREIFLKHVVVGETLSDIGAEYGVTKQRIMQIVNKYGNAIAELAGGAGYTDGTKQNNTKRGGGIQKGYRYVE